MPRECRIREYNFQPIPAILYTNTKIQTLLTSMFTDFEDMEIYNDTIPSCITSLLTVQGLLNYNIWSVSNYVL